MNTAIKHFISSANSLMKEDDYASPFDASNERKIVRQRFKFDRNVIGTIVSLLCFRRWRGEDVDEGKKRHRR